MIRGLKSNNVGTTDFMGRFTGMRKEQEFTVYPMDKAGAEIRVQSDTRFGTINLDTGAVVMSRSRPNGSNSVTLQLDVMTRRAVGDIVPADELETLKGFIRASGSTELVGRSIVKVENMGALFV